MTPDQPVSVWLKTSRYIPNQHRPIVCCVLIFSLILIQIEKKTFLGAFENDFLHCLHALLMYAVWLSPIIHIEFLIRR